MDEDNFDIDVYGDGGEEFAQDEPDMPDAEVSIPQLDGHEDDPVLTPPNMSKTHEELVVSSELTQESKVAPSPAHKISSTGDTNADVVQLPKQAPQTQGTSRHDGNTDTRAVDPAATTALFVSDLHWWISDDDVRGWANQAQCEDELEEITFNEHKVNGKSKGQAYVLFKSAQAATAVKLKIQSFGEGQQYAKNFAVSFSSPSSNPFRTLPKDGPARSSSSMGPNRPVNSTTNTYSNNYRGRGTGYNSRGGGAGHYNRGGYQAGAQSSGMSNFGQMNSMSSYGSFQGRGGMMGGMRGGGMNLRGGRGAMMGMPMNMAMGGMGMNMGMPGMGAMGMGGPQGGFNPAFFGTQPSNMGYDNPHPAKRTRQD